MKLISVYNWIIGLPLIFGMLGLLAVVVVDPYGVRGTGFVLQRLQNSRYPDREWARLLNISTRQSHDLVLMGASTFMRVDEQMMRVAFPQAQSPINISYVLSKPEDYRLFAYNIIANKDVKHLIWVMDFSLMERRKLKSDAGDQLEYLSATNWFFANDFSYKTGLASLNRLAFGTYGLPWWRQEVPDFMLNAGPITENQSRVARLRQATIRIGDSVFGETETRCEDIPFVNEVMIPFVKAANEKGVKVDLVFPPYSYLLYYNWMDIPPRSGVLLPGPVYHQLMTFKKCVVQATEALASENVQVLATDSEDAVSGRLANYMDPGHLIEPAAYRRVLELIANGRERLTLANLKDYETRLRVKVTLAREQFDAGLK